MIGVGLRVTTKKIPITENYLEATSMSPEVVSYFSAMELKTIEFLYAAILRNPGAFEELFNKNPHLGTLQEIINILQSSLELETITLIEEIVSEEASTPK